MDRHGICTKHGLVDPKDIYTYPSGQRKCRLCGREHMHKMRARKRWDARRPRKHKRMPHAFLTAQQIRAAHVLYKDGRSLGDVAELLWQRWGYSNPESARISIYRSFRLEGLPRRSKGEAQTLARKKWAPEPCGECGCHRDQRTARCKACTARFWYRKKKAASPSEEREAA